MNINAVVSAASQTIQQTQKNQKSNTDYDAEKLAAFKKELWNEIGSMHWNSQMNISIQITDKAFERMMNDKDFKNDMVKIIREESIAARPPGDVSLTWIDENGYKGYSYIDTAAGHTAFSAHSKEKDNFYVKRAKKKEDMQDYWQEQYMKRQQQRELVNEKYEDVLYQRKLLQRGDVARQYEEKTIKNSMVGM